MANKNRRPLSKSISTIGKIIFVPLGFIGGLFLVNTILERLASRGYIDWTQSLKLAIGISSGLFFAILLFFVSPYIMSGVFQLSYRIEKALSKYSAKEVVMGLVGLLIGLFLALAFWFVLNSIKGMPQAISVTITVLMAIIFGVLGMRLGSKLMSQVLPATNVTERSRHIDDCGNNYLLDSSALIDGRVLDIVRTGFLIGEILIPNFILTELSKIADDDDILKKNRGRRGLDIAAALQKEKGVKVKITDDINENSIDEKLIKTAQFYKARLITVDYNLNKLATANNIDALNINELSNAIKPIALPGEKITVRIVKEGKEKGQGIGYLPDGTMIVIENGGGNIGTEQNVTVTTALQTSAGRIIFSRIMD